MTIADITQGERLTLAITVPTAKGERRAELTAHYRYAAIDGLLWWALRQQVDGIVATAMQLPIHDNQELAEALYHGHRLLDAITYSTRYHHGTTADLLHIVAHLNRLVPQLAPLSWLGKLRPHYEALLHTVLIITARSEAEGDAWVGMEGVYPKPLAA